MIPFCLSSSLEEGQSLQGAVGSIPVFVVRRDGALSAYRNACPHLGIPLNWQENQFLDTEGELIQCATHGALFLIDSGECISGPCTGDFLSPIAVEERDGNIFLQAPE